MSTCRCKMCGGQINYEINQTTATCEFCGTEQTIASTDDTKKANLYNRANSLRLANEFDKALSTYESILIDSPKDAEAHWGICLCRYGIEYVDDPKTKKKIPTCHRTIFNSIFDDIDYKDAILNADVIAKKIYQAEADQIDKIQKTILAISQKEEPYDIFICYKESDENGNRTKDSVIAQEIYDELTKKDYKVFFARITLETKLGSQYEPIIFAALQSAKVMLAIGSKPEYYNAPWVKNEWSRYLSFMKEERGKYLIPCYKDMEAYDMPDEFLSLQAQNIDKLGFLQDLIYGIDKIFGRKEKKNTVVQTESKSINSKYLNLLKRAKLSVEDKDYNKASSLIEEVLNENAECAEAYIILVLIEFNLSKEEDLLKLNIPLDNNKNYLKALRFADEEYKNKLISYNEQIKNKINLANKERNYQDAKNLIQANRLLDAITILNQIKEYEDSEELIKKLQETIETYRKESIYKKAIFTIEQIFLNSKYTIDEKAFNEEINLLKGIIDYKDTKEKIEIYQKRFDELKIKIAKEKEERRKENERLALLRKEKEEKERQERIKQKIIKKAKFKRFLKFFIPSVVIIMIALILTNTLFIPTAKYNNAMDLINEGKLDEAKKVLIEIDDFKDTKSQITLINARTHFKSGNYEYGITLVQEAGGEVHITYDTDGGTAEKTTEVFKKKKNINNECKKEGYKFQNWQLDSYKFSNNNYKVELTLKAIYYTSTYSLTFNLNGGNKKTYPKSYSITSDDISIVNPTKEGYTFLGWTLTNNSTPVKDLVITKGSTGNRVYTAHWQANEYLIIYDTNGGERLDNQKVIYDQNYELMTPIKTGYKFMGWYYNNELIPDNKKWNYSLDTTDITITAKWELIEYNINYILNGGVHSENPKSYNFEDDDIILKNPTKEGYKFLGWTYEGSNNPNLNVKIPSNSINDKVFVAQWEAVKYNVLFDANGGNDLTNNKLTFTYDETFELPTATRIGYSFAGWYYNDKLIEADLWKISSDCILVAKWVANTYTINIVTDSNVKTKKVTYDDIYTLEIEEKNNYTFEGYFLEQYGQGTKITDTKGNSFEKYLYIDDINVYPYYSYKIEFVSNGGGEVQSIKLYENEYLDNNIVTTKDDKTFGGWYTDEKLTQEVDYTKALGNLTLYARWQEETIPAKLCYSKKNGEITITKTNFNESDLIIPNYIGGKKVTKIDDSAFLNCSSIKRVLIPEEINIIGNFAFNNCSSLTNITISNNVTSIGSSAFANCSKLTQITLPNSIMNVGNYMFSNCIKLTYIFIPNSVTSIGSSAFNNCSSLTSITIPNSVTSIGEYAFHSCSSLTSITIPNNVTSIGSSAFNNCSQLKHVSLPKVYGGYFGYIFGAPSFNYNSSYVLPSLKEVILTEEIDIVGSAFYDCNKIESITIPDCLMSIGNSTFENCNSLTNVYYSGKIEDWCNITFSSSLSNPMSYAQHFYMLNENNEYKEVTEIEIPNTVTSIGDYQFYGFSNVTSITIPNSVTSIGSSVFSNCSSLKYNEYDNIKYLGNDDNNYLVLIDVKNTNISSVNIFQDTKIIYNSAFEDCSSLTSITIPNSVTSIGSSAFSGCSSLTSITIPNSVTSIGNLAFTDCSSLTSIILPFVINGYLGYIFGASSYRDNSKYVPASLKEVVITGGKSIGSSAFSSCSNLTSITIPNSVTSIGGYAFNNCSSLTNVYYTGTIEDWCNIIFNGYFSNPMSYAQHFYMLDENNEYKEVKEIKIPYTVTSIGNNQFSGFNNITNIIISNSVTSIGEYAFHSCGSLTSITIPNNVTSIGNGAFYKCSSLTSITIPNNVTSIGSSAFEDCSSLKYNEYGNIRYLGNDDNNYLVLIGVKNTSISFVNIFQDTKIIYNYAFEDCSSLTSITIPNSVTSIGSSAFSSCSNLTSITIPDSVTSIGEDAFRNCSSLTNVYYSGTIEEWCNITFGNEYSNPMYYAQHFFMLDESNEYKEVTEIEMSDTETSIGNCQFSGFNKITSIIIPNSVTSIGKDAFEHCGSLTSIIIPNSVTSIGEYAFYKCSRLTNVYYSGTIEEWCNITFSSSSSNPMYYAQHFYILDDNNEYKEVTEIEIPNTITKIGDYQFYGFSNVTSITIPNSVTSIGSSVFFNCSSLKYNEYGNIKYLGNDDNNYLVLIGVKNTSISFVNILQDTKIIYNSAFNNCSSLTSITIPNSVTSIGSSAFSSCSNLTSITIPDSVTSIGSHAFAYCSSLINVYYSGTIEEWCNVTFNDFSSSEYTIFSALANPMSYAQHFYMLNENNEYKEVTEIELPNTVTSIGDYQFYGFNNVTSITIPNSVTSIGSYAFAYCSSLTSITIPNSVTSIGYDAFSGCSNLTI